MTNGDTSDTSSEAAGSLYLESSAVLCWLFGEQAQEAVLGELSAASAVFCSRMTVLESERGLIVAEAIGRITAAEANRARQLLNRAARGWSQLAITAAVDQRARQRFPVEPIRSLDAIHLASLLELHAARPQLEPLTLDRRIRDNAVQLGFSPRP